MFSVTCTKVVGATSSEGFRVSVLVDELVKI